MSAFRHPRSNLQGSRSCSSADEHPDTMKITRHWTDVVRASRPQSRERPAPARGQDARAPAGETPAPRLSEQGILNPLCALRCCTPL